MIALDSGSARIHTRSGDRPIGTRDRPNGASQYRRSAEACSRGSGLAPGRAQRLGSNRRQAGCRTQGSSMGRHPACNREQPSRCGRTPSALALQRPNASWAPAKAEQGTAGMPKTRTRPDSACAPNGPLAPLCHSRLAAPYLTKGRSDDARSFFSNQLEEPRVQV